MKNTIFTHGLDSTGKRFTMAAAINGDKTVVNYGISICRKGENFDKRLGRLISEGRAKTDPISTTKIVALNDELKLEIKEALFTMKRIAQEGTVDTFMKRNR